ncbi:glycosyltransferase family 2 protein [Methylococcus mesophilus]|uniref:glycosyltransferase family 2 protein n=1 Tax=Methylococcus mesophilus TaxID=2993564 RepID=UPI00224AEE25|nr:glycosyltransferase [Methylococcus mesophilus]UZR28728.1 glycosyltransferase [Methylococcus mesophilus]
MIMLTLQDPATITSKVSIGMPVYNGEKFIREALESLLTQTFTDFELIISDNASTDGTEAICHEYAARDPRIRYIRQSENRGATANFQFVLDEAVGEYFMWAAADDRRNPEFLRLALSVFEDDDDCGLVFCDYHSMDLKTKRSVRHHVGMYNSKNPGKNYLIRLLAPCANIIYGLHKTSILKKMPIESYDFFDVHLTHAYAINSVVKIIPNALFIAGSWGVRIPYSLTGHRIDPRTFFKEERLMLFKHLSFFSALFLYVLLRYMYIKSMYHLRRSENLKICS